MSAMRNDLRRLGVGTVIVAGGAQHEELNLVRRMLGPETYAGGGAFVWHDVRALVAGP
jgi:hypothetical protein